jgi:hypothetical protein
MHVIYLLFIGEILAILLSKMERQLLCFKKIKPSAHKISIKRNMQLQNQPVFMKNITNCYMDLQVEEETESKSLTHYMNEVKY